MPEAGARVPVSIHHSAIQTQPWLGLTKYRALPPLTRSPGKAFQKGYSPRSQHSIILKAWLSFLMIVTSRPSVPGKLSAIPATANEMTEVQILTLMSEVPKRGKSQKAI